MTGEAATNLATIELGVDRRVCIVSSVRTNVIVDVFAVMTAPPGSPVERLSFDKPTWPPFNAAATDYAIECGAGTTAGGGTSSVAMSIDLLPLTTATLSVAGGPPAAVGTGTTSFVLATDQPVVLATTREGVARNYHFRCVPTDFPRLEVQRPGNPSAGWYLTTSGFASTNPTRNGPFVMILDHYGAPVWYKRTTESMMDAKQLSDGRLAFTPSFGAYGIDPAQGYWLTTLDGNSPTDKHRTDGLLTDHHDYIGPDATWNFRTQLSYPVVGGFDLTGMAGGTNPDTIADGTIQELDGNGAQLWRWDMSDHFDPADSTFPINFFPSPGNPFGIPGFPDAWDVFHINAIDREPDGDYVVTVRHMDGVFRVDRDQRGMWSGRWGLQRPPMVGRSSPSSATRTAVRSGPTTPDSTATC